MKAPIPEGSEPLAYLKRKAITVLTQGSYPILDFDTDVTDPLAANFATTSQVAEVVVMAILGSKVQQWAQTHGAETTTEIDLVTARYPIWTITRDEHSIGLVEAPIGAPACVLLAETLINAGAQTLILTGSCGALENGHEGEFMIPHRALRDDGTSYHYQPASRWISTDPGVNEKIAQAVRAAGRNVQEVSTWTTDGLHRETPDRVTLRRSQGCAVVEMECAAMCACARLRRVRFGQLLFTADSLAAEQYDPRGWGTDFHIAALDLSVDAAFLCASAR